MYLHKERAFQEVSSSHLRKRTTGQQKDSCVLNPLKRTPVTIHLQGFRGVRDAGVIDIVKVKLAKSTLLNKSNGVGQQTLRKYPVMYINQSSVATLYGII